MRVSSRQLGRNAGQPTTQRSPGHASKFNQLSSNSARVRFTPARAAAPSAPPTVPTSAPQGKPLEQFPSQDIGVGLSAAEFKSNVDAYTSQPIERSFVVDSSQIEGEIPAELHGTLFRNGPGNFKYGSSVITAPFDGDGLLLSYSFQDGNVLVRRKFVRTAHMRQELKAGKLLIKGAFTVGNPSGGWSSPFDLTVREPANTGVIHWGGRTLALHEGGLPHIVDDSLRTTAATTTCNGVWEEGDAVGAHYRVCPEADGTQRLVMFSPDQEGLDMRFKVVELDESGRKVASTERLLPGGAFAFVHDMMVTDNYYIVYENPIRMDFFKLATKYVFGTACIAECLYLDKSSPTKIHCLPRPGKAGVERAVYTAPPGFSFHHINAYEAAGSAIVVETLCADNIEFKLDFESVNTDNYKDTANMTAAKRFILRQGSSVAEEICLRDLPALDRMVELPAPPAPGFSGRPISCWFALASRNVPAGQYGLTQEIIKVECPPNNGVQGPFDFDAVSVSTYYPGDGRYCEEPIFVQRKGSASEDDGYLLVQVSDRRDPNKLRTDLEIFDARDIGAGPLARILLPDHTPPGLHGSWCPEYIGTMAGEQVPAVNDVRINF